MLQTLFLLALLFQTGPVVRPTIIAKVSEPPQRNYRIIYYDNSFLFAARNYGDSRDSGGNTEPALFVHSKEHSKWIRILQISTAGGRFGKSSSNDPEIQKKMRYASVSWDFTSFAEREYMDQPLKTSGSIAFPEQVRFDKSTDLYELRYLSSWGIPSVETVLYVKRKDLLDAFAQ